MFQDVNTVGDAKSSLVDSIECVIGGREGKKQAARVKGRCAVYEGLITRLVFMLTTCFEFPSSPKAS